MKIFEKLKEIFRKPKPPEEKKEGVRPEPMQEASASLAQAGVSAEAAAEIATCATALIMTAFNADAATYALRRFAENLKPKQRSNNWRKMHGLPMRRKMPKQRRR